MILREIKNIYIKNRLTEGVDFKRYEWLKGDSANKAYINTTIYDLDSMHTIDIIFKPQLTIESVFGRQWTTNERFCIQYMKTNKVLAVYTKNYYEKSISTTDNVVHLTFDLDNSLVTDGTNTLTISGFQNQNTTLPLNLFNTGHPNQYMDGRIKNFIIDNKINLVPCQLIKSIPASLDANNKSRAAGECGMYDSITGKFYGNVANKGTFTVEGDVEPETHTGLQQIYQNRLIEGVDYETYDWLKADIPLNVTMMELPVNSNNVEYDLQRLAHGNTIIFKTKNNEYKYFFWQDRYIIGVYDDEGKRDVTYKSFDSIVSLFHIKTTSNSVYFNSVSIGAFGLPITNILFQVEYGSNTDITKTSSIKVDGVIRYVPCQLLRAIPRNLDAQCKERVAGECGMIDLISGKFYGNVANSGTFTVENDNNE